MLKFKFYRQYLDLDGVNGLEDGGKGEGQEDRRVPLILPRTQQLPIKLLPRSIIIIHISHGQGMVLALHPICCWRYVIGRERTHARGRRMIQLCAVAVLWGVTNVLMKRYADRWLLHCLFMAINLAGSALYYSSVANISTSM